MEIYCSHPIRRVCFVKNKIHWSPVNMLTGKLEFHQVPANLIVGKYDVTITVGDVAVGSTYGIKVNDKIFVESEVLEAN